MTILQSMLAFVLAASILTITPGVDNAMVLRSAAGSGSRTAVFAAIGISLGCLIWGALVSVGLGALLTASPLAFGLLKWAGAAYLVWIGIGLVWRPREAIVESGAAVSRDRWTAMRRGLLTNLLNPKIGVFYVTFLPQFVPAGVSVAGYSFLLACVHVLLGLAWFALLIAATRPLGRWLATPKVVRRMDRLTGGVFVGFGVKLALTR